MTYGILRVVNCQMCFLGSDGNYSAKITEETYRNESREHCFSVARVNRGLCVELPERAHKRPAPSNCSQDNHVTDSSNGEQDESARDRRAALLNDLRMQCGRVSATA